MAMFKDSRGKSWALDINIGDVEAVRQRVGIDLLNPTESTADGKSAQEQLQTDLVAIYKVLHTLCQDECDRDGITEKEFASRLAGASLRDAVKAFWEAWSDFFRDLGREDLSQVVKVAYETTVEVARASADRVGRIVNQIKAKTLRDQEAELDEIERSLSRDSGAVGSSSGTEQES